MNQTQLPELLKILLYSEAQLFKIPAACIHVPLQETIPDGGEDARIRWDTPQPEKTNWIPSRFTIFQSKAMDMAINRCKEEFLQKKTSKLKPSIEEVLNANGAYILFFNRPCVPNSQKPRIAKMREAIEEAGKLYAKSANIQIYDSNKIATWTNSHLSAITAVKNWLGKAILPGAITWQNWNDSDLNRNPYFSDEINEDILQQLRSYFKERHAIARLVGLSGIGKSRLALETFRRPEDPNEQPDQETISRSVIYINAATSSEIPNAIVQWGNQQISGIVIVDNCDLELHDLLKLEIRHKSRNLSLLTIDNNPENENSDSDPDELFKKLEPVSDDVIKKITQHFYPSFNTEEISRVVEFSQGFPRIAMLIGDANLRGKSSIARLDDPTLVRKLTRLADENEATRVISSCSLFSHFGITGDKSDQWKFIAKSICKIDEDDFYRIIKKYTAKGILDQRGRFIRVVPKPLAIRLATDWWDNTSQDTREKIFQACVQNDLFIPLCEQMKNLHSSDSVKNFVSDFYKLNGPNCTLETFTTFSGSKILYYFVEINPEACIDALTKVFGKLPKDEMLKVPNRRDIIWALEKLCFWKETFVKPAELLAKFAIAETESFGNNSTNLFFQLFWWHLSGTQAPPELRLLVLADLSDSGNQDLKKLAISAAGHALKTNGFFRVSGAESQGSRSVAKDWRPKYWKDIFDYWRAGLKFLQGFATRDDEFGELARKQIVEYTSGLIYQGRFKDLDPVLKEICNHRGYFWPELYNEFYEIIRMQLKRSERKELSSLKNWLSLLEPRSIPEKFQMLVKSPPSPIWDFDQESKIMTKKIQKLALECSRNPEELMNNLPALFSGTNQYGHLLGYCIGQKLKNSDSLLNKSLEILSDKKDERNLSLNVLGGFLTGIKSKNPKKAEEFRDLIVQRKLLENQMFDLLVLSGPSSDDLDVTLKLLEKGTIQIGYLRSRMFTGLFGGRSPDEIISFCDKIRKFGPEGILSALEILYLTSINDSERKLLFKDEFRKIILEDHPITLGTIFSSHDGYQFKEIVKILLSETERDVLLAKSLTKDIIKICRSPRFDYHLLESLKPIVKSLISNYFEISWPSMSKLLLSKKYRDKHNMVTLLGGNNFDHAPNPYLSNLIPPEKLIKWAMKNPINGPEALIEIIPLTITRSDNSIEWNPVVLRLLDEVTDVRPLLDEMHSKIGSFSWVGSLIPAYQKQNALLNLLKTHKRPEVRQWAIEFIKRNEREIEDERKSEEEESIGI
ncbi:MAG: hypothetical protein Q7V05_03205 [Methanoregula sp.]|nr:hypothetical protein [Methanoregula sp.]